MSSDASEEGAAEALDTLAWLDEDEADALAQLFDGEGGAEGGTEGCPARAGAARPARSASAAGSDGGSVCVAGAEQEEGEVAGVRHAAAPLAPLRVSARRDGLRWLDADCARGCDKCAPPARVAGTPSGRQRTPRPQ